MNESKQTTKQENMTNVAKGAATTHAEPAAWKKWLSKKWVFPAIYMSALVLILALMWVYQNMNAGKNSGYIDETPPLSLNQEGTGLDIDGSLLGEDALAVAGSAEYLAWPVTNSEEMVVAMQFYDSQASIDQKQAAMIQYENRFIPSTGISLTRADNGAFDVLAAMSGEVIRVDTVPLIGNKVEISHGNGLKTVYTSLSDVQVSVGDQVKQGDTIAVAGRNELEHTLGLHLHFEVFENDHPVNPETLLEAH